MLVEERKGEAKRRVAFCGAGMVKRGAVKETCWVGTRVISGFLGGGHCEFLLESTY